MNLEVLELLLHFFVSLLVIAGGGFMLYMGKGDANFIISAIMLVLYFWFQNMSSKNLIATLYKQPPTLPVNPQQVQEILPLDNQNVTPTTQTLEVITNSTNSPTTTPAPKTGNNI